MTDKPKICEMEDIKVTYGNNDDVTISGKLKNKMTTINTKTIFSPSIYPKEYENKSVGYLFADSKLSAPYLSAVDKQKTLELNLKCDKGFISEEFAVADSDFSKPIHIGCNFIHNVLKQENDNDIFTDVGRMNEIKGNIEVSTHKVKMCVVKKNSALSLCTYSPENIGKEELPICQAHVVIAGKDAEYSKSAIPSTESWTQSPLFITGYSMANNKYVPFSFTRIAICDIDTFTTNETVKNKLIADRIVGPLQYMKVPENTYPKHIAGALSDKFVCGKTIEELKGIYNNDDNIKEMKKDNNADKNSAIDKIKEFINGDSAEMKIGNINYKKVEGKIEISPPMPVIDAKPLKSYVSQIVPTYKSVNATDKSLYVRPEDILCETFQGFYCTDRNDYKKDDADNFILNGDGMVVAVKGIKCTERTPTSFLKELSINGPLKIKLLNEKDIANPSWYTFNRTNMLSELFGVSKESFTSSSNCAMYVCIAIIIFMILTIIAAVLYSKLNCKNKSFISKGSFRW